MSRWDPRAQLAWLLAVVVGASFGGFPGVALALLAALWWSGPSLARAARGPLQATLPLAVLLVALDALAGDAAAGLLPAARIVVLVVVGASFARAADGDRLVEGMRTLGLPFALTFVLVAGARFVPVAAADVRELRDAGRLRGIVLDGPPWRQLAGWRVLLIPLLVTTVRRGLQLGEAMEARAFGAAARSSTGGGLRWCRVDTAAALLALAYVVGVIVLASRLPSSL